MKRTAIAMLKEAANLIKIILGGIPTPKRKIKDKKVTINGTYESGEETTIIMAAAAKSIFTLVSTSVR